MNGLCECGCGNAAPIATRTERARGWVKGQPIRFVNGHYIPPVLNKTHGRSRTPEYRWAVCEGSMKGWRELGAVLKLRWNMFAYLHRLPLPRFPFGPNDVDAILRMASGVEGGRELICSVLEQRSNEGAPDDLDDD
jgi:hypothetical protein